MIPEPVQSASDSLSAVLTELLEVLEQGQAPDRKAWTSRYPQFAAELEEYFASREHLEPWAAPLRSVARVCAPTPRPEETPPPGERPDGPVPAARQRLAGFLPDYELLEEIGQGGMGVVYKARQKSLNRLVAVKMIRAGGLAPEGELRRFRNEAEAVASLDHPHIVPIHEVGQRDGQPYFTMKWMSGGSLADHLDRFLANPRAAVRLLVLVARAVHHAHQRGILHRDLKPSNILLDTEGQPQVTDFGLAKRLQESATLTETGAIVGTPGYMAPEQASGKKGTITTATDVYGLGALLYAMLTGRPPFRGDTPLDTLIQVKEREPQPPSGVNRHVDRGVEMICLKCLEKEPDRRYGSAEALAEDLQRWLDGEPILGRPMRRSARLWRWCKRNRAVAALTATTGVLLTAGLVGLLVSTLLIAQQQSRTQKALGEAEEQRVLAEKRELDVRRWLYVADINRAARSWAHGETHEVRALLERHLPAAGQEDLRGFEWYYLKRLCQGQNKPRLTLRDNGGEVYCVVFSPDGRTLATCGHDGHVRLWNPTTGQLQMKFRAHAREIGAVAFSPDGRTLATASDDGAVKLWDRATGQERKITQVAKAVVGVAFSPDGKTLAAGVEDGTCLRWELPSGHPRPPIATKSGRIEDLAFSSDGTMLATAGGEGIAKVWDSATGRLRNEFRDLSSDKAGTKALAFARHSPWLATADAKGTVALWSTSTGGHLVTLRGDRGGAQSVAFSPDDRLLVSAGEDGALRLWEMPSGKLHNLLAGHAARVWCVAFSPDGRTLASASRDGTVKLWDPELRSDSQELHADWRNVSKVAFAPGGRILATSSWEWNVRFWDSATGQLRAELPQKAAVTSLAFSPDGKSLACGYHQGMVRLWEMSRLQELWSVKAGDEGQIADLGFSPDGHKLMTGCLHNGPVRIWDVGSGGEPTLLVELASGDVKAAFSPDGKVVATCGARGIQFWDVAGGRLREDPSEAIVGEACLAFSPDGGTLATGGSPAIRFWYVATGQLATSTTVGQAHLVRALAFSPDGRTLASASFDGAVTLWNMPTGQELLKLENADRRFWSLAFSPDGRLLAAGGEKQQSEEGACQLWLTADEARPPVQQETELRRQRESDRK
jgi:WD40 repeat protein/tRNA A-37 threonylcarbamoyl transferase component Bud32